MTKPKPELAPIRALRTVIAELNDKVLAEPRGFHFTVRPDSTVQVQTLTLEEFDRARRLFGCEQAHTFPNFQTNATVLEGIKVILFGDVVNDGHL